MATEAAHLYLVEEDAPIVKAHKASCGWHLRASLATWCIHRLLGPNATPALFGPSRRMIVRMRDGHWTMVP